MRKESLKKDGTKNGMAEDQDNQEALADSFGIDTQQNGNETIAENESNDSLVDANNDPAIGSDVSSSKAGSVNGKRAKTKAAKKLVVEDQRKPATAPNGDSTEEEVVDYEVEDIVDHKIDRKKVMFLVRWKNYGADEDTWEPESSLSCPEIIAKYREAHPGVETGAGGRKRKAGSIDKASETSEKSKKKEKKSSVEPSTDAALKEATAADEDEEYEVDEIIQHKIRGTKNVFLIRWKGYGADADTWEKEKSLSCPEIVAKYKKEHAGEFAEDRLANAKERKAQRALKEYEVARVLETKKIRNEVYYLIRWKNCRANADSWERDDKLNCPDLIEKFKRTQAQRRQNPNKRAAKTTICYGDENAEGSSDDEEEEVIPKKKQRGVKPVAAEKTDNYEVEKIVDDKVESGNRFYLVKWRGYPSSQNTWQAKSTLSCPELLKEYNKRTAPATSTPSKGKSIVKSRKALAVQSPPKGKKGRQSPASAKKTPTTPKSIKKSATKRETAAEEPNWEVQEITDVKYNDDGSKNFLIRWKGCDSSQDTWEPESNLSCPALINKFMHKVDDKPAAAAASSSRKKKSSRK